MLPVFCPLTSIGTALRQWLGDGGVLATATSAAAVDENGSLVESVTSRRRRSARHLFLTAARQRPPAGVFETIDLPQLPDLPALADWLALPIDKLEWLATCGGRRRKRPLAQQHYVYQLIPKRSLTKATGRTAAASFEADKTPADSREPIAGNGGPRQGERRLRLIEAPRIELKAAQHRLLRGLLQRLPVHEACHGFVGGRSVVTHAQAHVGQPLVLRFDLQDFFSHVGEAQVRAVFDMLGFPHGTAWRLAALCVARTPEPVIERLLESGGIDRAQANRLRSAHLPQGAPTSPMLANLCAFRLDLRLAAFAAAVGARYTRYADDLVFSGPASIAGLRIEGRIGAIAIEEGFRLNHRKTRRLGAGARQTVAGIVVNERCNTPRAEFDRLRALLHRCARRGPAEQNVDGHADFAAHLRGRIAWVVQLNPSRMRRLQPLWDAIEWPARQP
jgi:hypothetical protein